MFRWEFRTATRNLRTLLSDGIKAGELRKTDVSVELLARCVLALTWTPESGTHTAGPGAELAHARDTLLRGAAVQPAPIARPSP
jgi:hypothetical protein